MPFGINPYRTYAEPRCRGAQLRCAVLASVHRGLRPRPTEVNSEWGPTPAAPPAPSPDVQARSSNLCLNFRRTALARSHSAVKAFSLVLIVAIVLPFAARAERARVALAQPVEPDEMQAEVATRIRAELEAAAFEVVVVALDSGADPRQGVELARLDPAPIAAVAIVRLKDRPAVDVWVSDRLTGKTLVKRIDVGKRPDAETTSALAIHAVELLRASLLEMRTQTNHGDASAIAETSAVPKEVGEWVDRAIVAPTLRPLLEQPAVGIAAAALYSSAGLGPSLAPALCASIGAPNGLAGRLSLVGPAFGAEVRSPSGSAFVRQELFVAELVYAPSRRWLSPLASAGLGGYHLYVRGSASDPLYRGMTSHVWAILADVGIGVAARVGSNAALSLDLHAFMTQPAARITVGDASFGTVGRPSLLASLGVVAAF